MESQIKDREIKSYRYEIVKRSLIVKEIKDLSLNIRKITFYSEDLKGFQSKSPDDHIKLFFENGEMRDYTPMHFDEEKLELSLAFHLHTNGVGANWAKNAKLGDQITIGGPRGSRVVPLTYDGYLLIVDETGIPALLRYLQEIPITSKIECIIEVESENHKIHIPLRDNLNSQWIFRSGELNDDISNIKLKIENLSLFSSHNPSQEIFTWILQEKKIAFSIKDYLLKEKNFNEKSIKATGYWIKD